MGIYLGGLDPLSTRFKMRYYTVTILYIFFLRLQDVSTIPRFFCADIFLKPFRFPSSFFVSQVRKAGMRLARRALQGEEAIDFPKLQKGILRESFFFLSVKY